ncbi:MAG: beta-ketoacyl synthase N-terminal-like domain-containing protein, partial [Syntrophales bacterium]|nr:beta-ketoacyl synthase N-terminal-like domain-containing protein [Syntrophales bacterium]
VKTGGMAVTEEMLKAGSTDPRHYVYHAPGSVSECIARKYGCTGEVLTVSTACSSGIVALTIALEMLRAGRARQVLAGGADSLCRLTYYGFDSLQLVDPAGARPFDRNRRGMSVGEGAAMFLLTAAQSPPVHAVAELLGAGLSCDAYHPAPPHPEGEGACLAMEAAIADARIGREEIDYIHLHGTGTVENDLAESRAIHRLFGDRPIPPVSSTKGAHGHALAAAGAIGCAISVLSMTRGILPANMGMCDPDPALDLFPVSVPEEKDINIALVNSFGFGGNNAVAVIGSLKRKFTGHCEEALSLRGNLPLQPPSFSILGSACLTGTGDAGVILDRLMNSEYLRGLVPTPDMGRHLAERAVRRLKRLPRIALSLAIAACEGSRTPPSAVFLGTGWGALSETYDFMTKLLESGEQFTSPTDFVGSVHNAAAGHIAVHFGAAGPNITTTGGDCAFEQALLSAGLLMRKESAPLLVIGADEYHRVLSPLFDASVRLAETPSDGGGALLLEPEESSSSTGSIRTAFFAYAERDDKIVTKLIRRLGDGEIAERFGAILIGIPASQRAEGDRQLATFLSMTGYPHPVIDYRSVIGEFAAASAVAAVIAAMFVRTGELIHEGRRKPLTGHGVLILGLGRYVTAMEVMP